MIHKSEYIIPVQFQFNNWSTEKYLFYLSKPITYIVHIIAESFCHYLKLILQLFDPDGSCQFSCHLAEHHLPTLYLPSLAMVILWQTLSKALLAAINHSPLIHKVSHLIIEVNQVVQLWFTYNKFLLSIPNDVIVPWMLWNGFQEVFLCSSDCNDKFLNTIHVLVQEVSKYINLGKKNSQSYSILKI